MPVNLLSLEEEEQVHHGYCRPHSYSVQQPQNRVFEGFSSSWNKEKNQRERKEEENTFKRKVNQNK